MEASMRSSWLRRSVSFGAASLCAAAALAGDSVSEQRGSRENPNQFGTGCCQILQIPSSSFVPTSSDVTWEYGFHGYVKPTNYGPGSSQFVATVTLPSGAALDWLDLYYCDTDPMWDIEATLRLLTGPTFDGAAPDYTDVATVVSSGSGGCGYAVMQLSHTINNDVYWNDGAQYTILVLSRNPIAANLSFKGVDLWWHRQVHPAPAVATFNDVPTNHPYFQFIEALADSGVTGGCGSGNYCPDNPLTRGQMAVFLAKALGLYWPY
jgi:S-layer homology domain